MRCSAKTLRAAAFMLSLLLPAAVWADDWPQWRGPNRDGACTETGLLQSFPAEGLKVRWRVPVGWGFSSPVISQGRVYLADSELMKPRAKERLHCFAESSGKPLWTHSYEVAYEDWAFDPAQEIGPVATPIVENGKVYTVGRVGHVFCVDARKGEVLWQRNVHKDYQVAFAPGTPSPMIEGELLILFIGGKPGACVVALHKDNGKEAWRALDESLTFSSPIVISSGGKKQLIVWTQESVTALDPATGNTWWKQRLLTSGEYAVSTPVFHKDRLLIGGLMFQLDPDRPAARVLWPDSKAPSRRIFSHTSTALFLGDHLYTAKSAGQLICVDAATGEQVWESAKVTDLKGGASIHMTQNGDSVLLYTNKGELIRARLTSQGYHELGRALVLEPTMPFAGRKVAWSPPAYANRHIFARSGKELICASLAAPVQQDQALRTMERGLAFLTKDALAWKNKHNCVSCHHAGLVIWSMHEAKQRGHVVDEPVLAELTKWVAESGDGKTGVPRPKGLPQALNAKAVWLALGLGAAPKPDAVTQKGLKLLWQTVKSDQTGNGSWVSWPDTRPPIFGNSDDSMTALATLALLPAAETDDEAKVVREKGVKWLAETKSDGDPQSIAMRLVLWKRLGRPAQECEPLVRRIEERQNSDGGWSQADKMPSDAWATGQALYALAHAGLKPDEPVISRAHAFLIKTQLDDGSWQMTSRPLKRGGEGSKNLIPITGAGSAWAILGLARSR
jgi:outer membrane protein assembly factor BamB